MAGAADEWTKESIKHAETLRDNALKGTGAYELVSSLTTRTGSRFAGSPGYDEAVRWAVEHFRKLGFDKVWTEPATVPLWERGEAEAVILAPFAPYPLVVIALGGSVGTPDEGIVAEVVRVPSYGALLEMKPDQVKGRIVFIDHRMERARSGASYSSVAPGRTRGAVAAARLGAVGLVIRSLGTEDHRFAHTGGMRYAEDVPKIPAAAMSNPDADLLAARIEKKGGARLRLRLTCRNLGTTINENVIGEITGREKPDEVVVLGAHLDSWDVGTGAVDDGSGCAIVMTAGHLIGKHKRRPARSVRVILFANEEFGLSGGKAYAEAHGKELAQHIMGAESDFGAGKIWRFTTWVEEAHLADAQKVAEVLKPLDVVWTDPIPFGGADLSPMLKIGMPVAHLGQDGTDYFDYHHTADDTLDKVNPENLDQNVAAYVAFAYMVADKKNGFGKAPPVPERR